jgi:hypothetical protein
MVGGVVGLQKVALMGFAVGMGAIKGETGMAWPEQRIRGVTVGCGRCMGAICDGSTIPRVVGSGWSCVRAGARLLVMFVTLWAEQSMGAWLVGLLGSLLANGANGLMLHVTR